MLNKFNYSNEENFVEFLLHLMYIIIIIFALAFAVIMKD